MAENGELLEAAHERMNLGQLHVSLQYQLQLQQNLIYLATHADDDPRLERVAFSRNPQPPAQGADEEHAEAADGEQSTAPERR